MEKIKIPYPIIVEGKYDKARLSVLFDAQILTTDGFGIFNKVETRMLLLALAEKTPLILLTDSDGAGKLIRSHISGILPPDRLIHLYTPKIEGKERRKKEPSAEGLLGVEGMENTLLLELLSPYADPENAQTGCENPLSKTDLYIDGLTGGAESRDKRDELAKRLKLPTGMTPNAFLAALRVLCTYPEYLALVGRKEEQA